MWCLRGRDGSAPLEKLRTLAGPSCPITMTTADPQTWMGGCETETTEPKLESVDSDPVSARLVPRQDQPFKQLKMQSSRQCPS